MPFDRDVTSEGLERFITVGFEQPELDIVRGAFAHPLSLEKEQRPESLARIRTVIGSVIGMTREAAVRRLCEAKIDGLWSLESPPFSTDLDELRRRRKEVGDIHPESADVAELWRISDCSDLPIDRLDLKHERAVDLDWMQIMQYADAGNPFRYVSAHGSIIAIECVVDDSGEEDLPNITAFEHQVEFHRDPQSRKIVFREGGGRQITESRTLQHDDHLIIYPEQLVPSISLLLPHHQRPRLSATV